jgi:hypothetical protein
MKSHPRPANLIHDSETEGHALANLFIGAVVIVTLFAIILPYLRRTVWKDPQAEVQTKAYLQPGKVFSLDCRPVANEFRIDDSLSFACSIGNTANLELLFDWELFVQSLPSQETTREVWHHLKPEPPIDWPLRIPGGGFVELRLVVDKQVQASAPRFTATVGHHDKAWIYGDKSWRRQALPEGLKDLSGAFLVSDSFSFVIFQDLDTPHQRVADSDPKEAFEVTFTHRALHSGGILRGYAVANRTEHPLKFRWCDAITAYTDTPYQGTPDLLSWHRTVSLLSDESVPFVRRSESGITFRARGESIQHMTIAALGSIDVEILVHTEKREALP